MKLISQNIAQALPSPTAAGMFSKRVEIVTVIERELLAGGDVPTRHDPEFALQAFDVTIRSAAMVYETRGIPFNPAVQIALVIQAKNAIIPPPAPPQRLLLGDNLAHVLDNPGCSR